MKKRIYSPVGELEVFSPFGKLEVKVNRKVREIIELSRDTIKGKHIKVEDHGLIPSGIYSFDVETLKKMVGRRAMEKYGLSNLASLVWKTPIIEVNYRPYQTEETSQDYG